MVGVIDSGPKREAGERETEMEGVGREEEGVPRGRTGPSGLSCHVGRRATWEWLRPWEEWATSSKWVGPS